MALVLRGLLILIPLVAAMVSIHAVVRSAIEEKHGEISGKLVSLGAQLKLGINNAEDALLSIAQSYEILGPGLLIEELDKRLNTLPQEGKSYGSVAIWTPQGNAVMSTSSPKGTYDIARLVRTHFQAVDQDIQLTRSGSANGHHLLLSRTLRDRDEFAGIAAVEIEPSAVLQDLQGTDMAIGGILLLHKDDGRVVPILGRREEPSDWWRQSETMTHPIAYGLKLSAEFRPDVIVFRTLRNQAGLISGIFASILLLSLMAHMLQRRETRLVLMERIASEKASELAAALEEMKAAVEARHRAELQASSSATFLATMSHELRTPMNGVLGMLDTLLDTRLDADQRNFAEIAQSSATGLLVILNDILDYTRLDKGAVELMPEPFSLRGAIGEVTDLLAASYRVKGLEFRQRIDERAATTVTGDPIRLKQILYNLLGNALKFTDAGSVELTVSSGASEGTLRFEVRDTGIGLSSFQQSIIFEHFTQVDSSNARKVSGAGLGLAISKQLVGLMGGAIGVASKLGKGSTFWFEIPLPAVGTLLPTVRGARDEGTDAATDPIRPLDILLVDDVEVNRKVAKIHLEKLGHRVDLARDGHEAVRMARQAAYDLIFMDVQMPTLDGVEATRRIRAETGASHSAPIVALSANVLPEQIEVYLAAGMSDHVGKPIRSGTLRAAIARARSAGGGVEAAG